MDEYNRGMDPELRKYFRRIINSFSMGLLWMMTVSTLGLFFGFAIVRNGVKWYNVLFYLLSLFSFILLIRYYYKNWKNKI
jgi:hypothetical protein